jgi:hypothetical protein
VSPSEQFRRSDERAAVENEAEDAAGHLAEEQYSRDVTKVEQVDPASRPGHDNPLRSQVLARGYVPEASPPQRGQANRSA